MTDMIQSFGRTIQLFLVDGSPGGLTIASIHGWTGSVLVATQSTFDRLLARPEVDRTGVYIFFGPDPENPSGLRAYIGEADSVRDRIVSSAKEREFWETVIVVTTSDEAINKGHGRYLEARLIEMARAAGRVVLDNGNEPPADRRRLSEADRANMETFIENLKIILPVVGLDLLKPRLSLTKAVISAQANENNIPDETRFEMRHKSNVKALAVEVDGEFVVLAGSQALKDTDYVTNSYARLREDLIKQSVLRPSDSENIFEFTRSYSFNSPSAAGSVILDRNTNGRTRWYVVGSKLNYHEWQEQKALKARKIHA